MKWSRQSRAAHVIAALAMVSLVAQGFLAAWLMPPLRVTMARGASLGVSSTVGAESPLTIITICSGAGLGRVVLDGEGNPVPPGDGDAPPGKSAPPCPLCTGLARCTLLLPAIAPGLPLPVVATGFATPQSVDALVGHRLPRPSVRDPPFSA